MTEPSYKAERQRIRAMLELGEMTPTDHARITRAINKAEASNAVSLARLERKREQNRRYYHRQKLKNQFQRSIAAEQTA